MSDIDEGTIDNEPAKRNLENALHSLDNMQNLINMLSTERGKQAAAINIGRSANGQLSVYITASDNVDEAKIARAVLSGFVELVEDHIADAHRAALVRVVMREQWRATVTMRAAVNDDVDADGGVPFDDTPHPELSELWPCADDVVAELLGER